MHAPSATSRASAQAHLLSILPKGVPPAAAVVIEEAALKAFTSHGPSAFEMSRTAAIVHECGPTIVGTAEGMTIGSVRIFSRSTPFGDAWGGWCAEKHKTEWTSGPDSSVEEDLSRARIIVAGLAGEAICGKDRPGSSIDELVVSQLLAG